MTESAFFWSSAPASPPSPSTSGVHFTADRRIQLCFHGNDVYLMYGNTSAGIGVGGVLLSGLGGRPLLSSQCTLIPLW